MGDWKMKKILSLFLLSALCFSAISVCEGSEEDQELNVMLGYRPITMDAQFTADAGSMQYTVLSNARLFQYDTEGSLQLQLAESYEVSDDGCVCTFHLRDGLRYSNGEKISAEDFVYAFRRLVDPVTASPCVYVFQELCHVKNAIEVNEGKRRGMQTSDCHENDRTFFYSFVLASVSVVY